MLPTNIEKLLLCKVEHTNIPHNNISITDIIKTNPASFELHLYKDIRVHWANLQWQTIQNYAKHLKSLGISIGTATRQELLASQEGKSELTQSSLNSPTSSSSSSSSGLSAITESSAGSGLPFAVKTVK